MSRQLEGKVAIITGGARGMGASHARRFVLEGARVLIADVLDDEGVTLANEIGDAAHYVHTDVTQESDWGEVVRRAVDTFGAVNVLVNNAGVVFTKSILDTDSADFRRVVDVNQLGVFLGIKAVAPAMIESGGGSIVNIASVDGFHGTPGMVAYVASKFAVRGITKVAALEFATANIRVNAVCPGTISTPMFDEAAKFGVDVEALAASMAPMGRAGQPAEASELLLFLASDASSYCTGADFVIDGGATAGIALDQFARAIS